MKTAILPFVALVVLAPGAMAQTSRPDTTVTGGTAGSASAGGTSASSVGVGASTIGPNGTSSSVAAGGSAASDGGHVRSNTTDQRHGHVLRERTVEAAHAHGDMSRSRTTITDRDGHIRSRTTAKSDVPGEEPSKSTADFDSGSR